MTGACTSRHRLTIEQVADRRGVVLELSGELDLATAPQLDRQLGRLGPVQPGRLLIDLRGLEFMDSAGLTSIVRAQNRADASGHSFCLRGGARQVDRLIELVGIGDRFSFED